MATQRLQIADKPTLDEILDKINSLEDTVKSGFSIITGVFEDITSFRAYLLYHIISIMEAQ